MKIGDKIFVRGTIDEIRRDVVIIKNKGGYFGTVPEEIQEGWIDTEKLWRTTRERTVNQALEIIDTEYWQVDEDIAEYHERLIKAIKALKGGGKCE